MTVGLKAAGFSVIGAVEIDPAAVGIYTTNHPEVHVFVADIRKLPARKVMNGLGLRRGELDLLAGCPPCQGFSTLTTLNGAVEVNDPRNDLIRDYVRFVRVLRPRALLMENVPGLLRDARMVRALDELERLGYPVKAGTRVVDAADHAVPQRRRRMVMMSVEGRHVTHPQPCPTKLTVRDVLAELPKAGSSGDPVHDHRERRTRKVSELIARIPKNGGSRMSLGSDMQLECHRKTDGFYDIYGRMSWDRPAPTITSGCTNPSKGRFLHPEEDRAITLREAAILQGFPPDYRFDLTSGKEALAAMIGNALPPPFVAAHAREIVRALLLAEGSAPDTCSAAP
jgi:DNA (cytosine-5)-methyltransferase 1